MSTVPFVGITDEQIVDGHISVGGDATLLSGHAGDPRTAAGDTTTDGQTQGRHQAYGSARRRTRTYRLSRTPPPDTGNCLTEIQA